MHRVPEAANLQYAASIDPENQTAGRNAGAGGNERVLHAGHLVYRTAAHLPRPFRNTVEAMDIGLSDLSTMGVDRKLAAARNMTITDEILGLAASAKPNSSSWGARRV